MLKRWFVALVLFLGITGLTRAARALDDVPVVDPIPQIVKVVTDWKTLGPLAGGISLVVFLAQVVKMFVPDTFAWKRAIVVLLALLYTLGQGFLSHTMTASGVLVYTLITAGGAMALYEAIKGALKTVSGKA